MKVARSSPDRIEMVGVPHLGIALSGGSAVCPVLAAWLGAGVMVKGDPEE